MARLFRLARPLLVLDFQSCLRRASSVPLDQLECFRARTEVGASDGDKKSTLVITRKWQIAKVVADGNDPSNPFAVIGKSSAEASFRSASRSSLDNSVESPFAGAVHRALSGLSTGLTRSAA